MSPQRYLEHTSTSQLGTSTHLKAVHVVNQYPVHSEQFIYNELIELSRRRVDIVLCSRNRVNSSRDFRPLEAAGIPVLSLKAPSASGFSRLARFACDAASLVLTRPRALISLLSDARKEGNASRADVLYAARVIARLGRSVDVFHAQFGPVGVQLQRYRSLGLHRRPVFVSFRGYDLSRDETRLSERYLNLFQQAACLLPVCEHFADRLRQIGAPASRIRVHYTPLRVEDFEYHPRGGEPDAAGLSFLAVGRFVEKKGFAFTLRAFAGARVRVPDIRLLVVGSGPLEEALHRLSEHLGLGSAVSFRAPMGQNELRELYRTNDVFLLHSITASDGDQEGIPNVLKEAMACGMPVVSTRHGGIPELVHDECNGLLVEEGDVDAFTNAIVRLANDGELRAGLGTAARSHVVEQFSIDRVTPQLLSCYREAQ